MEKTVMPDLEIAMTTPFCLGLDYDRGFYGFKDSGNIDAPVFTPAGSTKETKFEGAAYVVGASVYRG